MEEVMLLPSCCYFEILIENAAIAVDLPEQVN